MKVNYKFGLVKSYVVHSLKETRLFFKLWAPPSSLPPPYKFPQSSRWFPWLFVCVRVPGHLILTPAFSASGFSHWLPTCSDVWSHFLWNERFSVGKQGTWWDGTCKPPCLAKVSPVVQWLKLQGTASDQNDQEPGAWVVTTKLRTLGRRKGKSEEGGFKIHLVASRGRGMKRLSELGLFGLRKDQPRETDGVRRGQTLGLAGWSPSLFTVPCPLPDHHKQGLLLPPCVPGNDVCKAQASGGWALKPVLPSLIAPNSRSSHQVGRAGQCPRTFPRWARLMRAIFFHRIQSRLHPPFTSLLSDNGRKLKIHISCLLFLWICPGVVICQLSFGERSRQGLHSSWEWKKHTASEQTLQVNRLVSKRFNIKMCSHRGLGPDKIHNQAELLLVAEIQPTQRQCLH